MQIIKQKKVLKKEFLRALREGDEIIDKARLMARDIVAEAGNEAGRIRSEAETEGLEQGKAQATEIILAAGMQKERMLARLEKEVIELALRAAAAIIEASRQLDPLVVAGVYRKALASLEGSDEITLRVSPEDIEAARAFLEREEKIPGRVRIVKDGAVSPGGCIVESETGSVDGRIETQLEAIRRALAGAEAAGR